MPVPPDHVPQDAAIINRRFMEVPGVVSAVENTEGLVTQAGAGADIGLAIVAFDVAVPAAGNLGQLFVGEGDDLLVQFILVDIHILIHDYYLPFAGSVWLFLISVRNGASTEDIAGEIVDKLLQFRPILIGQILFR